MGAARKWTKAEDEIVLTVPAARAAKLIGCSKGGVRHRLDVLRSQPSRRGVSKPYRDRPKPFPDQGSPEWKKRDAAFVRALIRDAVRLGLIPAPKSTHPNA